MSKAAFDAKLAALDSLRTAEPGVRDRALRKALGDRNNYIVARAARVSGDVLARDLVPDLSAAFERFLENAAKTDPQCWAKNAIVKALDALDHRDPEIYVRGLRHRQPEPVWGGQQDTAGNLRAYCAHALVNCRGLSDLDLLEYLVDVLVDPDKEVRVEAARAVARIERRESALLLRLRALTGDPEPEPLAATLSALVAIEGKRSIPFLAQLVDKGGDTAQEAALALGSTHETDALNILREHLDCVRDPEVRPVIHTAIALTRLPEAIEFLLREAEAGSRNAREVLGAVPLTEEQAERLRNA